MVRLNNRQQTIKVSDKKRALSKAESYCAYQERSQFEVRAKLHDWGLNHTDVEEIISELIISNFLNEERFTTTYALGKFRIKHWGRKKIKNALQLKQVPLKMIEKALLKIDPDEYYDKLTQLLIKKAKLLAEKNDYKRRYKLMQYALGKGYEPDIIADALTQIS